VRGTVDLVKEGRVYITAEEDTLATAPIVDGRFTIEAGVPDAQVAYFRIEGVGGEEPFFPEKGEFTAALKIELPENYLATDCRIEGGAKQALYNEWRVIFDNFIHRFFMEFALPYERAEAEGDMARALELERAYRSGLQQEFIGRTGEFVSTHSTSDVAAYVVYDQGGAMFDKLAPEQQQSPLGRKAAQEIDRHAAAEKAAMQEGKKAPVDIPLDLPDGSTFTLGGIDAKLKIVVFWATTCPPCVQSIGPMREVYNTFHDKGVEMVWVFTWSNSREEWLAALEKFDMPWVNAFESNAGKPLERALNIRALPYKLVLGADNGVIAVNPSIPLLNELINNNLKP
jgi:thiol-disulfide isomerase/thioredoxin